MKIKQAKAQKGKFFCDKEYSLGIIYDHRGNC